MRSLFYWEPDDGKIHIDSHTIKYRPGFIGVMLSEI